MSGMKQTSSPSIGWRIEDAEIVVMLAGLNPLIGRDLFDALGISVTHTLKFTEGGMVKKITKQGPLETPITKQLPQNFTNWPLKNTKYQI